MSKDGRGIIKLALNPIQALASQLGLSLKGFKKVITSLNKLPFFKSEETSDYKDNGKWSNSKEIRIDEVALKEYLAEETPKVIEQTITKSWVKELEEDLPSTSNHDDFAKELELASLSKSTIEDVEELDMSEEIIFSDAPVDNMITREAARIAAIRKQNSMVA